MKIDRMPKVKVCSMRSERSNRNVLNQFIIYIGPNTYFQSYRTIIVAIVDGKTYLDSAWKYSRTTSKYRSQFLGETTADTHRKIESGEYTIVNLN